MGTNYYATFDFCNECGRGNKVHIGKQSVGHRFLFRSYGSDPIQVDGKLYPYKTGAAWILLLLSTRANIQDEYGNDNPFHSKGYVVYAV